MVCNDVEYGCQMSIHVTRDIVETEMISFKTQQCSSVGGYWNERRTHSLLCYETPEDPASMGQATQPWTQPYAVSVQLYSWLV